MQIYANIQKVTLILTKGTLLCVTVAQNNYLQEALAQVSGLLFLLK